MSRGRGTPAAEADLGSRLSTGGLTAKPPEAGTAGQIFETQGCRRETATAAQETKRGHQETRACIPRAENKHASSPRLNVGVGSGYPKLSGGAMDNDVQLVHIIRAYSETPELIKIHCDPKMPLPWD